MERKFVIGKDIETQLNSIDRTLVRFSRRLHKTIVGIIPPNLTSEYVMIPPEDGVLLRKIFPAGRLTKGFMFIGEYVDKSPVTFIAEVAGIADSQSRTFVTRKQLLILEPDLELNLGDRVTFRVVEKDKIKDIWIGFLFQVGKQDSQVEAYSIDKLEELAGLSTEVEDDSKKG